MSDAIITQWTGLWTHTRIEANGRGLSRSFVSIRRAMSQIGCDRSGGGTYSDIKVGQLINHNISNHALDSSSWFRTWTSSVNLMGRMLPDAMIVIAPATSSTSTSLPSPRWFPNAPKECDVREKRNDISGEGRRSRRWV